MKEIVLTIPIRSDEEKLNKLNEEMSRFPDFKPLKTTEEHILDALVKISDAITDLGDERGWYVDDSIKLEVKISYEPLDK